MSISSEKNTIRQEMKRQRAALSLPKKSRYDHKMCRKLWEMIRENDVSIVHSYLPFGSEIDLYPLLMRLIDAGIPIVSPKAHESGKMTHHVLRDLTAIGYERNGVPYPVSDEECCGDYDLVLVPGLAFDRDGYRLGYGGGYYDRFLADQSGALKWAPIYPFQLLGSIPKEDHDQRVDEIIYLITD